jgi:hypothetical protein
VRELLEATCKAELLDILPAMLNPRQEVYKGGGPP